MEGGRTSYDVDSGSVSVMEKLGCSREETSGACSPPTERSRVEREWVWGYQGAVKIGDRNGSVISE